MEIHFKNSNCVSFGNRLLIVKSAKKAMDLFEKYDAAWIEKIQEINIFGERKRVVVAEYADPQYKDLSTNDLFDLWKNKPKVVIKNY